MLYEEFAHSAQTYLKKRPAGQQGQAGSNAAALYDCNRPYSEIEAGLASYWWLKSLALPNNPDKAQIDAAALSQHNYTGKYLEPLCKCLGEIVPEADGSYAGFSSDDMLAFAIFTLCKEIAKAEWPE